MLALGWMGAGAGFLGIVTQRMEKRVEIILLAAYGWIWGFLYGAILNLWFWPFVRDGGALSWEPGLSFSETLQRYWGFYVGTSLAWDAAGALANAVIILIVGVAVMQTLRRFAHRLEPVVILQ
jgi:energy-coupling factor transport system substrate-specific component